MGSSRACRGSPVSSERACNSSTGRLHARLFGSSEMPWSSVGRMGDIELGVHRMPYALQRRTSCPHTVRLLPSSVGSVDVTGPMRED